MSNCVEHQFQDVYGQTEANSQKCSHTKNKLIFISDNLSRFKALVKPLYNNTIISVDLNKAL